MRSIFNEAVDFGNYSAGGQRNIPRTYPDTVLCGHAVEKPYCVIVIIERFTAPHHNNISNGSFFSVLTRKILFGRGDFRKHFPGGKVSDSAVQSRSAEGTAHPAACLSRDAEGIPVAVPHQDSLDDIAVLKLVDHLCRIIL